MWRFANRQVVTGQRILQLVGDVTPAKARKQFRLWRRLCRRVIALSSEKTWSVPDSSALGTDLQGARWEKLRSKTDSAMRFLRISMEPPAIIQPRQRRMQYSTRVSLL